MNADEEVDILDLLDMSDVEEPPKPLGKKPNALPDCIPHVDAEGEQFTRCNDSK